MLRTENYIIRYNYCISFNKEFTTNLFYEIHFHKIPTLFCHLVNLVIFHNLHFLKGCATIVKIFSLKKRILQELQAKENVSRVSKVHPRFLIKFDMKPCMHQVEISIFSLNNVMVRLTKIMNNLHEHYTKHTVILKYFNIKE